MKEISVLVKASPVGDDRIGEIYSNPLIGTEAQAVEVGMQILWGFFHSREQNSISVPYTSGIKDSSKVTLSVGALPPGRTSYRVTNMTITVTGQIRKVRMALDLEGRYAVR